jgi:hypothetical protein
MCMDPMLALHEVQRQIEVRRGLDADFVLVA